MKVVGHITLVNILYISILIKKIDGEFQLIYGDNGVNELTLSYVDEMCMMMDNLINFQRI